MKFIFVISLLILFFESIICDDSADTGGTGYKMYPGQQNLAQTESNYPSIAMPSQGVLGVDKLYTPYTWPTPATSPIGLTNMYTLSNTTCSANSAFKSICMNSTIKYPFTCNGLQALILNHQSMVSLDGYPQSLIIPRLHQNSAYLNGNFIQLAAGVITQPPRCAGGIIFEVVIYLANSQYQCVTSGVNGHKIIYQLKLITGNCQSTCWLWSGNTLLNPTVNNLGAVVEPESEPVHEPEPERPAPEKPHHPKPEKPQAERPYPERPYPEKPQAERPYPEKPQAEKPYPERPYPERPYPEKPQAEKPYPERPYPEKPQAERPYPERPYQEKPQAERPYPERPYPEKPQAERPYPERPYPEKPQAERPYPERPYPEKPYPERPLQPHTEKPYPEKPYQPYPEKPYKPYPEKPYQPYQEKPYQSRPEKQYPQFPELPQGIYQGNGQSNFGIGKVYQARDRQLENFPGLLPQFSGPESGINQEDDPFINGQKFPELPFQS